MFSVSYRVWLPPNATLVATAVSTSLVSDLHCPSPKPGELNPVGAVLVKASMVFVSTATSTIFIRVCTVALALAHWLSDLVIPPSYFCDTP